MNAWRFTYLLNSLSFDLSNAFDLLELMILRRRRKKFYMGFFYIIPYKILHMFSRKSTKKRKFAKKRLRNLELTCFWDVVWVAGPYTDPPRVPVQITFTKKKNSGDYNSWTINCTKFWTHNKFYEAQIELLGIKFDLDLKKTLNSSKTILNYNAYSFLNGIYSYNQLESEM